MEQLRELEKDCHILVPTTGILVDFMERGKISLKHYKYVFLYLFLVLSPLWIKDVFMFLFLLLIREYVFPPVGREGSTNESITCSCRQGRRLTRTPTSPPNTR